MPSRVSTQRLSASKSRWICAPLPAALLACLVSLAGADDLQLLRSNPDPYGCPRPAPGEANVPTGTSFFFQLGFSNRDTNDTVSPDSLAVRIQSQGGPAVDMLCPGRRFADGHSGKVFAGKDQRQSLAVYIERETSLKPATTYVVSVRPNSRQGAVLNEDKGSWQFTTEAAPATHPLQFPLDLSASPVRWHGGFFTGFCKPSFCTSASNRLPGYELSDRVRKQFPRAWSLQRDFWPTGMEHQPGFLSGGLPNVVRERETRRITALEKRDGGVLVRVEDFFGHAQYGIASNRPLADDYHPGDEVLVADGVSHARAKVVAVVDDPRRQRA